MTARRDTASGQRSTRDRQPSRPNSENCQEVMVVDGGCPLPFSGQCDQNTNAMAPISLSGTVGVPRGSNSQFSMARFTGCNFGEAQPFRRGRGTLRPKQTSQRMRYEPKYAVVRNFLFQAMKEIQIGVELVGGVRQRGGIGADPDREHIFNIGGSSY